MKKIGIIGASGFVGSHLIRHLLEKTAYNIVAISPNPDELDISNDRVASLTGDVFDTERLKKQLQGVDVAFYFVHMMAASGDYYEMEERAARSFGEAAGSVGVERIIYMSGLGRDNDELSKHLSSRHNTGDTLREFEPLVIEFRAAMIIGEGSISFQIVKNLIHKLPLLLLPPATNTKTQPIALDDMLKYLTRAITVEVDGDEIVEVGGPEVLTYEALLNKYAHWSGRNVTTVRLPYLPCWLAGWWLNLFNPSGSAKVGRAMVDSFKNEMIVTNNRAAELFPDISPGPMQQNFT